MAAHALPFLPGVVSTSKSFDAGRCISVPSLPSSSLFVKKLVIATPPSSSRFVTKRRCSTTLNTVSLSLPIAMPEGVSSDKVLKWSARAIKSFALAELEARKFKYPNTGTEALLMGILVEGTSKAAKFLRENEITLAKVREETVNLLGKSDTFNFSPEHPPLTAPARRAIEWAVNQKLQSGENGEITVARLLLGIWSEKESAGHRILATLGFDDEKAKEIAKSSDQDVDLSFKKATQ